MCFPGLADSALQRSCETEHEVLVLFLFCFQVCTQPLRQNMGESLNFPAKDMRNRLDDGECVCGEHAVVAACLSLARMRLHRICSL